MPEAKDDPEPSMEEILASIRRIITEEGEGGSPPAVPVGPPPRFGAPRQEDVLELTQIVSEDGSVVSVGVRSAAAAVPSADADPAAAGAPGEDPGAAEAGRLISATSAEASVSALAELVSRSCAAPERTTDIPLGAANRTLEDIVRDLLRPVLKEWLDANLPQIVERLVRSEIARLVNDAQRR